MREAPTLNPFKITICGIDELYDHAGAGITHVVSILDPTAPEPRAFARYRQHARLELRFHDVIEHDATGYHPPLRHHVEQILAFGRAVTRDAASGGDIRVLVHCHAGISRSTAAAVLLLAAAAPDRPPDEIMAEIAAIRPKAWPNLRMIEMGDTLLGRDGDIVRAVRARHRQMAAALPHVAEFMRASGRARELDGDPSPESPGDAVAEASLPGSGPR
jgi:predicted protein tyrosine phosphatase